MRLTVTLTEKEAEVLKRQELNPKRINQHLP